MEFLSKTNAIELIKGGKESNLKDAMIMLGRTQADVDTFISEVKSAIADAEFAEQRNEFSKSIYDQLNTILPEIEGDMVSKLEKLTETWTKMPVIGVNLQRIVNKDKDTGVETVTYSWNKTAKFSGASSVTTPKEPKPEGETGSKSEKLPAPKGYNSWSAYVQAVIPSYVKAYIDGNAGKGTSGMNAHRLFAKAVDAGEATIPVKPDDTLFTIEELRK